MSIFPPLSLIAGLVCYFFAAVVLFKGKKSKQNRSFFLATILTGIWSLFPFLTSLPKDKSSALLIARLIYVVAPFVPTAWFYFLINLLGLKKERKMLAGFFLGSLIFSGLSFNPLLIKGITRFAPSFYPKVGPLYLPFVMFFVWVFSLIFLRLYGAIKKSRGSEKNQLIYIAWAYVFGGAGGAIHLISGFINTEIIPHDLFIIIYPCILAYAVVRYSLMDIRVTITRTGIFIGVYTLVIGLPIFLSFFSRGMFIKLLGANWWLGPLGMMTILAPSGQFVYIYLHKRAEAILLREQLRYQKILRETAMGMTRIRNPHKLLKLIVDIISDNVRVSACAVYLFEPGSESFLLRSCRNFRRGQSDCIAGNNPLIGWLVEHKKALIYEEVIHKMQEKGGNDAVLNNLEKSLKSLRANLIVPLFLEEKLLGFLMLGEKHSGALYTTEDLNIFSVLAGQSALAIENALLYENIEEKVKERGKELMEVQKQLIQAEKLATMGTLAGGVAHEINNPLAAILTNVQMLLADKPDADTKESLELIEEATKRCKTIVQKLMAYAKKPMESAHVSEVNLLDVIKNVHSLIGYQLEQDDIRLIVNSTEKKYPVIGNQNEIEQVLTNMILNARDALKQIKKRGGINIDLSLNNNWVVMEVRDEGAGIPKDIIHKVFDPFFTTKEVGKGVGLGLSICQSIVEKHNGLISVQSEPGRGTSFIIKFPKIKEKAVLGG